MHKTVLSGILLTSLAYFLFTVQDASVKWLVAALPVLQILFVRSVTIFAICLAIGRAPLARRALVSPVMKPMILRNLLLLSAWLCYYTAARDLGLAELTTLYYASPVIMTLLAVPVLGEVVSVGRWLAVITGFIGVVVACNVIGTGMAVSLPVCLALLAATFWAISSVLLRKTALQETTLTQMLISSGFFILFTGAAMPFVWTALAFPDLLLMAATGVLAGMAQYALFEGMRRTEVSVLAPFEYSSLIWAFVLGFAIWGDVPAGHVVAGALLIFAAGFIVLYAERASGRRRLGI